MSEHLWQKFLLTYPHGSARVVVELRSVIDENAAAASCECVGIIVTVYVMCANCKNQIIVTMN